MQPGVPDLTVLVPAYNEGERLVDCVHAVARWCAADPGVAVELLVVDDGSTDDTGARLERLARDVAGLRTLRRPINAGKGAALRAGMAAARGRRILFLDADLAVTPEAFGPALALLDAGADLVVGCRNVVGASVTRPQGLLRRSLGRAYLRTARVLLGLRTPDITCGFKAFDGAVGRRLFAATRCRRWGIDAEVLHLAEREALAIEPLAVTWCDGGRSAVRPVRDALGSFGELLAARWRGWFTRPRATPPRAEAEPTVPVYGE